MRSIIVVAGAVTLSAMASCDGNAVDTGDTEESVTVAFNVEAIRARANRAGDLHTAFMRYTYMQLKAERLATGKPLTREATARVLRKACLEFYRVNSLNTAECVRTDRLIDSPREGTARNSQSFLGTSVAAPYDQYLAAIEAADQTATTLQQYHSMLTAIEDAAIADPLMYSDTLDLELVLSVTAVARESATYADTEVESWGELYDPCYGMFPREEWCPVYPESALVRVAPPPGTIGTTDLDTWAGAGWRILAADVGAAIGGGLTARIARLVIPQAAGAAAAVASTTQAALEIVAAFE